MPDDDLVFHAYDGCDACWLRLHGGRPKQRWLDQDSPAFKARRHALLLMVDLRRSDWPHPIDVRRGDADPSAYHKKVVYFTEEMGVYVR